MLGGGARGGLGGGARGGLGEAGEAGAAGWWALRPTAGGAAHHAEGSGGPAEAVGHELVDLLARRDAFVHHTVRLADHREVDAVRDEAPTRRRVVLHDRVLPAS